MLTIIQNPEIIDKFHIHQWMPSYGSFTITEEITDVISPTINPDLKGFDNIIVIAFLMISI